MDSARPDFDYDCVRSRLGHALSRAFSPLTADRELDEWLAGPGANPHGFVMTQLTQVLASFMTVYEAHGVLGSYSMHLLSSAQWQALLGAGPYASLLDVGAGAGYVTEGARGLFSRLVCSETSRAMRRRLRARGFEVHDGDLAALEANHFDVVSCFNVFDRTARPHALLRSALGLLAPRGRLLIALSLPLSPHVHVAGGTVAPDERLPSAARTWEEAARDLTVQWLEATGLTVERLARAPYLSRGDTGRALYVLDAAVWVCRKSGD